MASDLDLCLGAVVCEVDHPDRKPPKPVLDLAKDGKAHAVAPTLVVLLVHGSRFLAGYGWYKLAALAFFFSPGFAGEMSRNETEGAFGLRTVNRRQQPEPQGGALRWRRPRWER